MAVSGSSSVFSQTLQDITTIKLEELSKRRRTFEDAKISAMSTAEVETDPIQRLRTLIEGVKKAFNFQLGTRSLIEKTSWSHKSAQLAMEMENIDRFLAQARHDPSVSRTMLSRWEGSLLGQLETKSFRFQYASLYGQLVNEWLSSSRDTSADPGDEGVETGEKFENLSTTEKLESRMEWERTVFEPANVDEAALQQYLGELFGLNSPTKEKVHDALKKLRDETDRFCVEMSYKSQLDSSSASSAISGLLASDLLLDEKRDVLKDFQGNPTILAEIVDVLNMRLGAIDSWSWGEGVTIEQTRKISGVYDFKMHEDLLQAILLQHIGVKWSVFFKRNLKRFQRCEGAWESVGRDIPKADKKRLEYFLGNLQTVYTLNRVRESEYRRSYFVAQLLDHEKAARQQDQGDEEAEYGGQKPDTRADEGPPHARNRQFTVMARRAPKAHSSPMRSYGDLYDDDDLDDGGGGSKPKTSMERKQRVLHLLSTEIAINTAIHGEISAFHSVFKSWNSLLPHETALGVLGFLGVSDTWLSFFRRFLAVPIKFADDDATVPARQRCRGTPVSHVLSDVFGEAVLFCLDLAINQATSGQPLWRVHDDVWFWSSKSEAVVKAWETVTRFAEVTGTSINEAKTGSVRVGRDEDAAKNPTDIGKSLPRGEIRWGFLRLSPSTGRFEIDQSMVDTHIKELRKQLHGNTNRSVLAFVQTWNVYATTFFSSNFGVPANCFGVEHVDEMLATHERIQREVLSPSPEKKGQEEGNQTEVGDREGGGATSVVDFLERTIESRFGVADVPNGFLFFPVRLGGLDLRSPFITLLQISNTVFENPRSDPFERLAKAELEAYTSAKENFLKSGSPIARKEDRQARLPGSGREGKSKEEEEDFLSFEEYVRYREDMQIGGFSPNRQQISEIFINLMKRPEQSSVALDPLLMGPAIAALDRQGSLEICGDWNLMTPYWKWVAAMYGPEIVERFGELTILDSGLLPMGMVSIFREKKVKWQG